MKKFTALFHILDKEIPNTMNQLFKKKLNKILSEELSKIFKDKTSDFQGKRLQGC